MSTPAVRVVDPGLLTTVQDRGRYGFQRIGVPVSGAMDEFALRAANLLVGNDESAAALEVTVVGPRLKFQAETRIVVTGANLSATVDGESVPRWQSVVVAEGSELAFGQVQDGTRAYVAFAGGIDVPLVMGSHSTYTKSGIGGLEGRSLHADDLLATNDSDGAPADRRLPAGFQSPRYGDSHEVRVVLGPQREAFSAEAVAMFLAGVYRVSNDADRMGYRLEGPPIPHVDGADVVSDGNPLGAVQVPGDGQPRVLMADRGTTGGYAKIATVIGADIGVLAQAIPGDTVGFSAITVEEAHQILREQEQVLTAIASGGPLVGAAPMRPGVAVDGVTYEVVAEDGEVLTLTEPSRNGMSTSKYQARAAVDGETFDFEVDVSR